MGSFKGATTRERGVVPVVAAILILSVIVAFFTIFYKAYIDSEYTKAESELADRFAEIFLRLKESIEEISEGDLRTVALRLAPDLPLWVPPISGGSSIWVEGWEE